MKIPFTKFTCAGNDFIIIDNCDDVLAGRNIVNFVQRVCSRRQAVGADSLILVEKSEHAVVKMRLFNSDGSEASMSGNGGRAFASYVHSKGFVKADNFLFETEGGDVEAWIGEDIIRIRLSPAKNTQLNMALKIDETEHCIHYVEIQGTPHGIIYWDDLDETPGSTIIHLGRRLRNHPTFIHGANINFTEVMDEHTLRIRTYERGVEDETLACGTGSLGASVVSHLLDRVKPPVRVKTSSGEMLEVTWSGSDILASDLYLGGEVRHVVDGFILPQAYID